MTRIILRKKSLYYSANHKRTLILKETRNKISDFIVVFGVKNKF